MTQDPWQSVTPDEPSQPALAGVDLMPKQGGYSLQDILQLHDTALHLPDEQGSLPTVGRVTGPVAADLPLSPPPVPEPAAAFVPPPTPERPTSEPSAPPMPAMNPFAAFSMPARPAPSGPPSAKRGGLPMIDPSEFATAAVDRIDTGPAPVEPPAPEAAGMASEVQLHALQQSLAALDELEAQLTMIVPEPASDPEPSDWVDALATKAASPQPVPSPVDETSKPLIGPTTSDDVVGSEDAAFAPAPIERLEPAVQFPFPGMGTYADEPAVAEPVTRVSSAPAPVAGVSVGDPPFFFHLDGEPVDLATDLGIAACEEAARSAIADAGRTLQTMLDGQQRQRCMQELMARVHAGGLSVDEVIGLGHELERLRGEVNATVVDRRAISALVARLEQQRALMGRLIDFLWRT
jgi:hypothetical protein